MMKPAMTRIPLAVMSTGGIQWVAGVLHLASRFQAGFVWGFDAQKDAFEARVVHHPHHLLVVGQIHGGFSGEAEGVAPLFLPGADLGQQQLGVALVADEVVVYQKDRAPEVVQIC